MIIGFVSDIHEDIRNLEKALKMLYAQHVDEVICLGDIVGYNVDLVHYFKERDAGACVRLVKKHCSRVIMGNHDFYAIRKTPEYNGGFAFDNNWYEQDFQTRKRKGEGKIWLYEETELSNLLSAPEKAYLDALPETAHMSTHNMNLVFTHYIYPNVTGSAVGFVEHEKDFAAHFQWMSAHHYNISFSGHGHTEGLLVSSAGGYNQFPFDKTVKLEPGTAVLGPCIARSKKQNGIMVFDVDNREVTALQIDYQCKTDVIP